MMNKNRTTIERRLGKLEAQLLPPAPQPMQILTEPGADVPPAEREAFDEALRDAVAAGARVWVVVAPGTSNDREPIAGVSFVDAEWKACLGILGQREGGLAALWDRLGGNIFRPAGTAAEPDAEAVPGDCSVLDDEEEEAGPSSGIRSRWGAGRA